MAAKSALPSHLKPSNGSADGFDSARHHGKSQSHVVSRRSFHTRGTGTAAPSLTARQVEKKDHSARSGRQIVTTASERNARWTQFGRRGSRTPNHRHKDGHRAHRRQVRPPSAPPARGQAVQHDDPKATRRGSSVPAAFAPHRAHAHGSLLSLPGPSSPTSPAAFTSRGECGDWENSKVAVASCAPPLHPAPEKSTFSSQPPKCPSHTRH